MSGSKETPVTLDAIAAMLETHSKSIREYVDSKVAPAQPAQPVANRPLTSAANVGPTSLEARRQIARTLGYTIGTRGVLPASADAAVDAFLARPAAIPATAVAAPATPATNVVASRFGSFKAGSGNGGGRIPSREDAAKMLLSDPDASKMRSLTSADWRAVSLMGKNGNPNKGNIDGRDRQVAFKLATGTVTPNLQLAGCEIVRKLSASGLL